MRIKIYPSQLTGTIVPPSSKSMGHRALICAALANGVSQIFGLDASKDIQATQNCLQALGARFQKQEDRLDVVGCDPKQLKQAAVLNCQESGSTLRFLLPVAALSNQTIRFEGQGRLMARPMKVYEDLFSQQALFYKQEKDAIQIHGPLQAGDFMIPGDVSSQFISGLLFALPLLSQESRIEIKKPYESKSYVDLTLAALAYSGIHIEESKETYFLEGNQTYEAKTYSIEKDFSQMAFFAVAAAIQAPLTIRGMNLDSAQGDKVILSILEKAGTQITYRPDSIEIAPAPLHGQVIDLADCPDLGPIVCVLAAFSQGESRIIHAGRLRMKESDRIAAMEEELRKWGVDITSDADTITIRGKRSYPTQEGVCIHGHNDHRIVMACTIFALNAGHPTEIEGAEAIAKSYPTFFEEIKKLHGKVEKV